MRRREFIILIGSTVATPLAARAQQAKGATIGLLGIGSAAAQSQWTAAFVQRMRELGWVEGRNLAIEYRWADGRTEHLNQLASELVRLNVDVIVTSGTPGPLTAKQATSTIPIVFATAGDPVGTGIVANLARPGGNVTGLSSQTPDVAGKRLELMREIVPGLHRLAMLADTNNPFVKLDVSQIRQAGAGLGIEVATFELRRGEDIHPAFQAFKGRVQALYVPATPVALVNRIRINTLALAAHVPTMFGVREYVEVGGLMSYGSNWPHMWGRAADFVDKILRGAKPADLPVEQPTKFDFVINLTTAKALGLTVSDRLLALADEVIE
jgi:putative ABC transport system substrate-binding protein